jgi:hypothetical protein
MASRTIKLVQGDANIAVEFTLTDKESGDAIDVSASTVTLYYRKSDESALRATVVCTFSSDGSDGRCIATLPEACMEDEGAYQGEVEILTGSQKQTMFDLLNFTVREQLQV